MEVIQIRLEYFINRITNGNTSIAILQTFNSFLTND